ncbi:MAG TPA: ATP-binding cassette domain-containing protein [Candidatus Binataceae bacterium]
MSFVEVHDVVVAYGDRKPVLNRVSLSAARGERVAILGPSGIGKTTLFRAINGFVPLRSGSICIDGAEVASARGSLHGKAARALRTKIGVIAQGHDLVDRLRVHQNVMAGALGRWPAWRALRYLVWPAAEEIAEAREALQAVNLADKLKERTENLSGGEHQRAAIARALVQKPSIMLADEPVASLDPALSEQVLTLLCGLADQRGITLLCTLHQPHLAERFFDRVVRLADCELDA